MDGIKALGRAPGHMRPRRQQAILKRVINGLAAEAGPVVDQGRIFIGVGWPFLRFGEEREHPAGGFGAGINY